MEERRTSAWLPAYLVLESYYSCRDREEKEQEEGVRGGLGIYTRILIRQPRS